MPDIRYVCVSDLHLGADNSLLTAVDSGPGDVDPSRPSEVLVQFAGCLREVLRHNQSPRKPTLILNGDILELALAQDNIALMAFERFMELMFPADAEPLFDPKIIFNPGNHDHHLWETARETQYVEFVENRRTKKPGPVLPKPWHTTDMFEPDLVESSLLNAVLRRHPQMARLGVQIGTVYPNLCLMNAEESRCVIFSHGHYIEWVYMLMTTLGNFVFPRRKLPQQIWDVEEENFAWIDFFWSAMGRSGEVGKDIEQMYDMSLVPKARRQLIRRVARAIGRRWFRRVPKIGEWLGLLFVPLLMHLLNRTGTLEKTQPGQGPTALTPDAQHGLRHYLEGPVAKQILTEREQPLRAQTSFAFGHTHKPFTARMDFHNFPPGMGVYNTGGWVVDTEDTETSHGGAVVLVDDDMNVASIRMYNESARAEDYRVRVETADGVANPLYSSIANLVNGNTDPWLRFSRTVAEQVDVYHRNFRKRLKLVK